MRYEKIGKEYYWVVEDNGEWMVVRDEKGKYLVFDLVRRGLDLSYIRECNSVEAMLADNIYERQQDAMDRME